MGKNAGEIVIGSNGSIFSALPGSPIPASINDPFDPASWIDLGYASEDGVTWADGKSLFDVNVWQSFYPARKGVESREGTATFTLMQWNGDTVKLAYGGGDVVEVDDGAYRYVPPDPSEVGEKMLGIEWEDGDKDYRLVLPRGMVSDGVETNIVRTAAGMLPITFSVLGTDGSDPWFFDTNDPAFAAAAGSGS